MKKFYLISVIALLCVGCQSNFVKVDFKYSNLSHMTTDDAIIELDIEPDILIHSLSNSFRAQNNQILERKRVDYVYRKTENSDKCWSALNEIFQAEFLTYQQNSFTNYKKIDRLGILAKYGFGDDCKIMEKVSTEYEDSWLLKVEVPQGNYETTISVPSARSFLFYSSSSYPTYGSVIDKKDRVISTSFSSVLYIWASKLTPESKTKVYLFSRPVNEQVESCFGCSIGYKWWKEANGFSEFKLVKQYKFLLEDLARSEEMLIKLEQNQL